MRHLHRCEGSIVAQWRSSLLPACAAHTHTHARKRVVRESARARARVFNSVVLHLLTQHVVKPFVDKQHTCGDILLLVQNKCDSRHSLYITVVCQEVKGGQFCLVSFDLSLCAFAGGVSKIFYKQVDRLKKKTFGKFMRRLM